MIIEYVSPSTASVLKIKINRKKEERSIKNPHITSTKENREKSLI